MRYVSIYSLENRGKNWSNNNNRKLQQQTLYNVHIEQVIVRLTIKYEPLRLTMFIFVHKIHSHTRTGCYLIDHQSSRIRIQ